jgi:hypothetical protein
MGISDHFVHDFQDVVVPNESFSANPENVSIEGVGFNGAVDVGLGVKLNRAVRQMIFDGGIKNWGEWVSGRHLFSQ